jgi:hypothetical protein
LVADLWEMAYLCAWVGGVTLWSSFKGDARVMRVALRGDVAYGAHDDVIE